MRMQDIIIALTEKLPLLVDDFTTLSIISNIVNDGFSSPVTTFTVTTTTEHDLSINDAVFISGVDNPIAITSFAKVGIVGTITTTTDHDLTDGKQDTVTTSGSTDVGGIFNDTFTIISIPNRKTIKVAMDGAGNSNGAGPMRADDAGSILNVLTGIQKVVTSTDDFTFTYEVENEITLQPVLGTSPAAKTKPRISGIIDIETFSKKDYTKQFDGDAWLMVEMGEAIANKNRKIDLDAVDNMQTAHYFNQKIYQNVNLYVFLPSTGSESGRPIRDRAEELLQPICQSILMRKFDSLMDSGKLNSLQLLGHNKAAYNEAWYVHLYEFQMLIQLDFEDTVGYFDNVAFRDINLTLEFTNSTLTASVDLDDEAL